MPIRILKWPTRDSGLTDQALKILNELMVDDEIDHDEDLAIKIVSEAMCILLALKASNQSHVTFLASQVKKHIEDGAKECFLRKMKPDWDIIS
jgi:hypothetical protein